ncbi:LysR family transcriptional regulator [Caballeronia telluris]|uniref:LysR family transcriptional regulator n=2 Tax=Caballeronia telluris TaxID=326475 RepID=A0A158KCC8_9BURK|nr:LysR family transcriptional regulator [Caballeronia telluris]
MSLSKAADEMHIALSAASRRIGLLEDEFGVGLLRRLPGGGVEPTDSGMALAAHVRILMRNVDQMTRDMRDYAQGARGHVRIHANVSALSSDLPMQLATFATARPEIKLEVREARSIDVVKSLKSNEADVGVVVGEHLLSGLQCAEYKVDRLCVVVPGTHAIRSDASALADLLDYDFVGFDNNAAINTLMQVAAAEASKPLRLRVTVQSYEAACRMIEAGFGLAIMPEQAARTYMQALNLRFLTLTDSWANRNMYVCIREGLVTSPVQSVFQHLIAQSC